MNLSIIIVSWNVREKLKNNLAALFKSTGDFDFEVFVIDNGSVDGTGKMVTNEFPQVKLIANDKNLGFAKANNQAIKYAQGEYILLLNPDMKVFPDTLANMLGWMDNYREALVAGCHLIDEKGNTVNHVCRFPTVWDQLAVVLKIPHLFPYVLNRYLNANFDYSKPAKVDSIRGSFFMIRSEAIEKIGNLDERYFIWFEEVDYCQRIKRAGFEVWYTPAAECIDYMAQSFKQIKRGKAQKYFRLGQLKYFKKWHPAWQYWVLKLAWPVGIFLAWVGELFKYKSESKT